MSSVPNPQVDVPAPNTGARRPKRGVPEGLWIPCDGCKATLYRKRVDEALGVLERDGAWILAGLAVSVAAMLWVGGLAYALIKSTLFLVLNAF